MRKTRSSSANTRDMSPTSSYQRGEKVSFVDEHDGGDDWPPTPSEELQQEGEQDEERNNGPFRREKLRIIDCLARIDGTTVSGSDILDAAASASQRFNASSSSGIACEMECDVVESFRPNSKRGEAGIRGSAGGFPGAVRVRGPPTLATTDNEERPPSELSPSQNRTMKREQLQAATRILQERGTDVSVIQQQQQEVQDVTSSPRSVDPEGSARRNLTAGFRQDSNRRDRSGRSLASQRDGPLSPISPISPSSALESSCSSIAEAHPLSAVPLASCTNASSTHLDEESYPQGEPTVERTISRDPEPSPMNPIGEGEVINSTDYAKCGKGSRRRTMLMAISAVILTLLVVVVIVFVVLPNHDENEERRGANSDIGYTTCADIEEIPDIWNQCQTSVEGTIQVIPSCQQAMYTELMSSLADYLPNELTIDSCDATNMALLSMADTNPVFESNEGYGVPILAERLALTCLYFFAHGDEWTYTTNWLSGRSHCSWHGITCDDSESVVEIGLDGNNLKGQLPSELAILTNLKSLQMERGSLEGTIPSQMYRRLSNLEVVSLQWNVFREISAEIGNWLSLTEFDFGYNSLGGTTLPSEMGRLSNLAIFNCENCHLDGPIPSELGNCKELKMLLLRSNFLSGTLPTEMAKLTNLQYLDMTSNNLEEGGPIPSAMFRLTQLTSLSLADNSFKGSLPGDMLKSLTNLKQLFLFDIGITGTIPTPELPFLAPSIQILHLGGNNVGGTIPSEIGTLTRLEQLQLTRNKLTGPLPSEIGLLTKLTTLELLGNGLDLKKLPPEVQQLMTDNGLAGI